MAQSFLLTTALIEELQEHFSQDPQAIFARKYLEDYRNGFINATELFSQLLILREKDKTFFRRLDEHTNGQWTNYVLLLVR